MGGLVLAGDAFAEVATEEFGTMLRRAIGDVLGYRPAAGSRRGRPRRGQSLPR